MERHEINRQKNRKHYSKKIGTYITIAEIGQAVRDGDEVEIYSKALHLDITQDVLTTVIHENELAALSKPGFIFSQDLLKRILLSGGAIAYAKQLESKVAQ